MTTSAIRETLHNYLEIADDNKLQAMYAIMVDTEESALNDEVLKQEVDRRYQEYKEGKVTMITAEESQTRIQALLSKKAGLND